MCELNGEKQSSTPSVFGPLKARPVPEPASSPATRPRGSRRRRLWELPPQALCPVIGVCLPMPVLRRRLGKTSGSDPLGSDYELHCGAIQECSQRTAVAELLQRELESRYALAVRQASACKDSEALCRWWQGATQDSGDVAGALWATLCHARCDGALQERVLRDIHMLQHQVGVSNRADLQRLDALREENAVLGRELARAQSRSTQLLAERARQIEQQQNELLRLRGELLARDTELAALRDELARLHAAEPGLRRRQAQAEQLQLLQHRLEQLGLGLAEAREQAARERRRADEAEAAHASALAMVATEASQPETDRPLPALDERAVLCVGGRPSVVPIYRQLIERTGGRFLHHDGGEEDAQTRLDASLAAADLVICQTGCISHDAYWRVKDHCKRHGKQCVFVDKPSASSLQRALTQLRIAPAPVGDAAALSGSRQPNASS